MAKKLKDSALVVVDMLYDFIDGSMACQGAEGAIAGTLKAIDQLTAGTEADETGVVSTYPILFIRDHHPADHCSFAAQGGPWPPHCVQGTHGADVHESLLPYVKEDLTFFKDNLHHFSPAESRLINPHYYKVDISDDLYDTKMRLIDDLVKQIQAFEID